MGLLPQERVMLGLGAVMLVIASCTALQQSQVSQDQAAIQGICAQAAPLVGAIPSIGIYVTAACASEAAIARIALDPSTVAWITNLYNQLKAAVQQ